MIGFIFIAVFFARIFGFITGIFFFAWISIFLAGVLGVLALTVFLAFLILIKDLAPGLWADGFFVFETVFLLLEAWWMIF